MVGRRFERSGSSTAAISTKDEDIPYLEPRDIDDTDALTCMEDAGGLDGTVPFTWRWTQLILYSADMNLGTSQHVEPPTIHVRYTYRMPSRWSEPQGRTVALLCPAVPSRRASVPDEVGGSSQEKPARQTWRVEHDQPAWLRPKPSVVWIMNGER